MAIRNFALTFLTALLAASCGEKSEAIGKPDQEAVEEEITAIIALTTARAEIIGIEEIDYDDGVIAGMDTKPLDEKRGRDWYPDFPKDKTVPR